MRAVLRNLESSALTTKKNKPSAFYDSEPPYAARVITVQFPLPSLSKICEKIVFNQLYSYLLYIGFLHPFQSGFRPGHSTVLQLTYIIHHIYHCLEEGKEVRAVFFRYK